MVTDRRERIVGKSRRNLGLFFVQLLLVGNADERTAMAVRVMRAGRATGGGYRAGGLFPSRCFVTRVGPGPSLVLKIFSEKSRLRR